MIFQIYILFITFITFQMDHFLQKSAWTIWVSKLRYSWNNPACKAEPES